jgi:hypothetical protein
MRDIVKLEGDTGRYVKMQEIDLGEDIKRSTKIRGDPVEVQGGAWEIYGDLGKM